MRFASTDVLLGSGNFEEGESESDLETVLKEGEVFTRRTKNKMKKKRMRQFERYLAMLSDPENSETEDQIQMSALSDKDLRAIRLRVDERRFKARHDARTRFTRAGLAVLACVKLVSGLRKNDVAKSEPQQIKLKARKKKDKPGKRVKFDPKMKAASTPGAESTLSEEIINKMSPKERFMLEFGWMLNDLGVEMPRVRFMEDGDVTERTSLEDVTSEAPTIQTRVAMPDGKYLTYPGLDIAMAVRARDPRTIHTLIETPGDRSFEGPVTLGRRTRRSSLPTLEKPSYLLFKVMTEHVAKKKGKKKNMKKTKPRCVNNIYSDLLGEKNKGACNHNYVDLNVRGASRTPINDEAIFEEVRIELSDLRRSASTSDISNALPDVDLRDVIKDIDFPAKEIKLQIVERKLRRQRKKRIARMQREVEARTSNRQDQEQGNARKMEQRVVESEASDEQSTEKSMKVHLRPRDTPFVTSGVAWNQKAKPRLVSPSQEEIDKQLPGLSRLFLEMRDCKYIRWSCNDRKIIERLREVEYMYT
jgi:hypothetical protein